jgi:hypothetical protein
MALDNIGVGTYHFTRGFDDIDFMKTNPGLLAYFGRTQNGGFYEAVENSLEVKYDVVRSKVERERLLRRSPGGFNTGDNSKVLKAALFTTESSDFPQITAKGAIEYGQLFDRVPNEPPTTTLTTEQRTRWYAEQLYKKMVDNINNTLIVKGWESIRTGKMTVDDGTGDYYYWGRAASNDAAAGAVWTNAATDILTDIDTRMDKIQINGKVPDGGDFMLPGTTTWAGMRKNTQLTSEADNRGYMFIRAGSREALPAPSPGIQFLIDAGLKYQAWIKTPKGRDVYVLTSNEFVDDPDTGTATPLMPVDEVLFGWSGARCDWKTGPRASWGNRADEQETARRMGIDIMSPSLEMASASRNGLLDSRMFHVKTKPTGSALWFEIETNPLLITTHADAFARLTGTA